MRTTRQLSVTFPTKWRPRAERVTSGEYASESEVIREGLRALTDRERAVERWLREEVVPIMERMDADPGRAKSLEDVRATIANAHERA